MFMNRNQAQKFSDFVTFAREKHTQERVIMILAFILYPAKKRANYVIFLDGSRIPIKGKEQ